MTATRSSAVATTLERELDWLQRRIADRLQRHVSSSDHDPASPPPQPPELIERCTYGAAVAQGHLDVDQRLALILALAPWLRPHALDPLMLRNAATDRPFTEFGGVQIAGRGLIPTRQTALFLIAGDALDRRLPTMAMFGLDGVLVRNRLIAAQTDDLAPWLPLEVHPELAARLFRYPN